MFWAHTTFTFSFYSISACKKVSWQAQPTYKFTQNSLTFLTSVYRSWSQIGNSIFFFWFKRSPKLAFHRANQKVLYVFQFCIFFCYFLSSAKRSQRFLGNSWNDQKCFLMYKNKTIHFESGKNVDFMPLNNKGYTKK